MTENLADSEMTVEQEIAQITIGRPHVVILGAHSRNYNNDGFSNRYAVYFIPTL